MTPVPRLLARALCLACLLVLSAEGCRAPQPDASSAAATYDPKTGRLRQLTADFNRNGRVDTWVHMDGARILRAERDRDEDGRLDYWEFNLPDGRGGVDSSQEDTNGDGVADKWYFFEGPLLRRVEWDDNHDRIRDRRWTYGPDGSLELVESGPDGRGGYLTRRVVPAAR